MAPGSVNRLRDWLSGMFKRARRLGLVTENPVKDIQKSGNQHGASLVRAGAARLARRRPADGRPHRAACEERSSPPCAAQQRSSERAHGPRRTPCPSRRPRGALRAAGREDEAARLDGVTWHALRHTFASRLVAAGVDLRTVQELGGWKTLSMVQRYAHLSPDHLAAAVEKIVAVPAVVASEAVSVREHRRNFDSAESSSREVEVRH